MHVCVCVWQRTYRYLKKYGQVRKTVEFYIWDLRIIYLKNNCNFLQGIEKKNISLLWLYNNSNFSKISKNPFVESRYKKNVPNVIIICREIGGSLESFSSIFFFPFPLQFMDFYENRYALRYNAILHPFLSTVDGTLLDISFFNLTKRMHAIFYHV